MEKSESKARLVNAYVKINLFSAILAGIIYTRIGIITSLMFFLFSIHAIASIVYLCDLNSLKTGEVIEKVFLDHLLFVRDGEE